MTLALSFTYKTIMVFINNKEEVVSYQLYETIVTF